MTFESFLLNHEATLRLSVFVGIFALIALWELLSPRRSLHYSKPRRWFANVSLVVVNTLVVRLLFPVAAMGIAVTAANNHWGILNQTALPTWLAILLAIVAMDLIIYGQHRLFHKVPWLWRVHRVHHADVDYDVTLGSRFHPVEIILSMLIKLAAVVLLGAPPAAVVLFEVLLNGLAMFNHGNISMPLGIDRALRLFVVTPDMHRVHHSVEVDELNSNFGFQIPLWDRLFGTYKAQAKAGHLDMVIGLPNQQHPKESYSLAKMLWFPFKRD